MLSTNDDDARFARGQLTHDCATMQRLLLGLLDSHGTVASEVHAIRKLGKSLRGGFGLFRLEKTSAREIQAIGRLLSGPRDAVSRLSTWQKLEWADETGTGTAIAGLLDQQTHSAARKPPLEAINWCVARVKDACQNLEQIPEENLAARITKGAKKLRKRVDRRCRNLDHLCGEDFHDARKALKAYLGAIGFLPEGSIPLDPAMIGLAEILGDENDLATLSLWLEEHGFTRFFAPLLWEKLEHSRKRLRRGAIKDAKRLLRGGGKPAEPKAREA